MSNIRTDESCRRSRLPATVQLPSSRAVGRFREVVVSKREKSRGSFRAPHWEEYLGLKGAERAVVTYDSVCNNSRHAFVCAL